MRRLVAAAAVLCVPLPAAVAAAAAPDSAPKPVQIALRLVEVSVTARGRATEHVLQAPILGVLPDRQASASIVGQDRLDFKATAHRNADGHLSVSVSFLWDRPESAAPLAVIHRFETSTSLDFRPGERKSLYVGSIPDRRVSDAIVARKRLPATGAPYAVYRLDATPQDSPGPSPEP